ncbi:MAG: Uma2 family endonuclease [Defluviitaleaceae bacterium]|nr:Uma2 family endonuclease [Defluviitaleaceae bacterium]
MNFAYENLLDLDCDYREEILKGKVVKMAPRPATEHLEAGDNILTMLKNYLWGKDCRVFSEPDVYLGDKDLVVPDVAVVCNHGIIKSKGIYGAPDLIVEVLSRSTAPRDRGYKKNLYEQCGVSEYWLVSVAERFVEVYLLEDGKYVLNNIYTHPRQHELDDMTQKERDRLVYQFKTSIFDDLVIDVRDVFQNIN